MKGKIVIYIMVLILILWGIIFCIDYTKCSNLSMPVFVVPSKTADDGGTGMYYGLGYKVYVKKHISVENGEVIEKVEMYFLNKVISASISDKY